MKYKKPKIVAEIGCNHAGSLDLAKKLIDVAAVSGASYAKFQKRNNKYLLKSDYNKPHPNPVNSFGSSYGKHREFLEFSIPQHYKLFQHCKKRKIKYAISVWEVKSAEAIVKSKIDLDYLKIPSACNLDFELIEFLLKNFKNKIHLSLGMTSQKEIDKIVDLFVKFNRNKDLILYACTSDYPVDFDNVCLLEITRLKQKYENIVNSIAFSGHHLGIAVDVAAYTLGANLIERHFTLDRTMKGTDHSASLEPDGLKKLIRNLNTTYISLKEKKGILNCEKFQRKKLKRNIT
jgi:N-acetylneuraminate synthase